MKKLAMPLLGVICLVMIVLMRQGFIFVLFSLLPSITAFFVDNIKGRPTFKTVLICNLAGMLPWLVPMLISAAHLRSHDTASVMANPFVWLVVLGSAGVGWCLIYICSFMARFFIAALYEYNAVSLERFQKKLVEEWGDEIVPQADEEEVA